MIVLVVAVIATGIISRPLPDKVPQVRFSAVNSTNMVNGIVESPYSINITHEGGDEIPAGEYAVFINDFKVNESDITVFPGPDKNWSIGKTLTVSSTVAPDYVRVYYTGIQTPTALGQRPVGTISTTYIITATTTGNGGTISPAGTVNVYLGNSQQFIITPDLCYDIADVLVDSVSQGNITGYTFTNIQGSHAISASFTLVGPKLVPSFTANPSSGSAPLIVNFYGTTSGGTPNTWNWNFGDGSPNGVEKNPVHNYPLNGNYLVNLTVSNRCGSITSPNQTIIVGGGGCDVPSASFTANPNPACARILVQFNGSATGTPDKWYWSFGDGHTSNLQNATNTYSSIGPYTVSLIAHNSCGNSTPFNSTITVGDIPTASFVNPNPACARIPVQFNDTSTGNPTNWSWEFGDGNTSNEQNPVNTYNTAKVYSVLLSVSNNCTVGSPPFSKDITVNQIPVASFTADETTGCVPMTVQFTNTSTGNPTNWNWSFGDIGVGNTSTLPNPTKTYTTAGIYTVSLIAGNIPCGNSTPFTRIITVNSAPVARFNANQTSGCLPLTVLFTDTSTGAPTRWYWSFGDGKTSTTKNPVNTYSSAGTYIASLIAGNSSCNSTPFTRTITVSVVPVANFIANVTTGCQPLIVQFTDSSTNTPNKWYWAFGDGKTSTIKNPVNTYSSAGTYTASLIAGNASCNSTPFTRTITVNPMPVAAFTANPTSGTAPLPVLFMDQSTGGTITSWNWNFGDNNGTSSLQNPSYTYMVPGTYTVNLTVTNAYACNTNSTTKTVTVYQPLCGYISGTKRNDLNGDGNRDPTDPGVAGWQMECYNKQSGQWVRIGTTTTDNNGYYIFTGLAYSQSSEKYEIREIRKPGWTPTNPQSGINDPDELNGPHCCDVGVDFWNHEQTPVADFIGTPRTGNLPLAVQFTNTSTGGTPATWSWNFGDGGISAEKNPIHIYTAPGIYTVSLNATNTGGSNTKTQTGYITVTGQQGFTAEAWVRWNIVPSPPADDTHKWATIVVDGTTDNNRRYQLEHDQNNTKFEFAIATTTMTGAGVYVWSTTTPVVGTWYYVTGVYNQTPGIFEIYVDGARQKYSNVDSTGLRSSPNSYQVGGPAGIQWPGPTTMNRKFDGDIWGLNTYERALSPAEIQAHATGTRPP